MAVYPTSAMGWRVGWVGSGWEEMRWFQKTCIIYDWHHASWQTVNVGVWDWMDGWLEGRKDGKEAWYDTIRHDML